MFNYDYSTSSTGIIIIMLLTIVVGVAGLTGIFINDIKDWRKKKKGVDK
jgi:hypothetical protein